MSTIYLVRHGTTAANKENRFAGRTAEPLSEEGIEQICLVGERLRTMNIDAIYCGPAVRTVQSAEIIGTMLAVPSRSLTAFDEINIPHWEGLTKDEIRSQYGGQYPAWLSAPQDFAVEGCETLAQVQYRAVEGLNRILAADGTQHLLLISHLIILRCLVLYFKRYAIRDFRSVKINNGAILEVSEGKKGEWSVGYLS
ncbi:MAG: histidine phosphatase family protein [Desulfobulbales bacterium]